MAFDIWGCLDAAAREKGQASDRAPSPLLHSQLGFWFLLVLSDGHTQSFQPAEQLVFYKCNNFS